MRRRSSRGPLAGGIERLGFCVRASLLLGALAVISASAAAPASGAPTWLPPQTVGQGGALITFALRSRSAMRATLRSSAGDHSRGATGSGRTSGRPAARGVEPLRSPDRSAAQSPSGRARSGIPRGISTVVWYHNGVVYAADRQPPAPGGRLCRSPRPGGLSPTGHRQRGQRSGRLGTVSKPASVHRGHVPPRRRNVATPRGDRIVQQWHVVWARARVRSVRKRDLLLVAVEQRVERGVCGRTASRRPLVERGGPVRPLRGSPQFRLRLVRGSDHDLAARFGLLRAHAGDHAAGGRRLEHTGRPFAGQSRDLQRGAGVHGPRRSRRDVDGARVGQLDLDHPGASPFCRWILGACRDDLDAGCFLLGRRTCRHEARRRLRTAERERRRPVRDPGSPADRRAVAGARADSRPPGSRPASSGSPSTTRATASSPGSTRTATTPGSCRAWATTRPGRSSGTCRFRSPAAKGIQSTSPSPRSTSGPSRKASLTGRSETGERPSARTSRTRTPSRARTT